MSIAFSINHATVTAMVGLASANLKDLGNLQNALLYLFYTFTALLASKSIVGATGAKGGIVAGLGMYMLYVGSFILADTVPSIKRPAAIIGGCLGGIAAGFLWTAQFAYFGENVNLYAEVTVSQESASVTPPRAANFTDRVCCGQAARDELAADRPGDVVSEEEITEYCRKVAWRLMVLTLCPRVCNPRHTTAGR